MKLGMQVGLSPSDIVFDDPVPSSPKKGAQPSIFGPFYCDQTAGWIKMPLGMEVGLDPGHIVLDGNPSPPQKGHDSPLPSFRPMSIVDTFAHLSYF